MRIQRYLLALVGLLVLVSCDGQPTDPPVIAVRELTMIKVSGDNQTGIVGQPLPKPIVVKVVDRFSKPVKGQIVNFLVVAGGGSVFAGASITNANGISQEIWTLGTVAGSLQKLEARYVDPTTGAPVTLGSFTATAIAGPPAALTRILGDNQPGLPGLPLPDSLKVQVTDRYGNPVIGAMVAWAVTQGGGSVLPVASATSTSGVAATGWRLGSVPTVNTVVASVSGLSTSFSSTSIDPNWIVFLSDRNGTPPCTGCGPSRDIYVMRPDGSQQQRVTTLQMNDFTIAAISPDGWTIAFARGPDGAADLWLVNRDGSGLRQLTSGGDAGLPAWSHDGTKLLFRRSQVGIFTVKPDGSGLTQLTAEWDFGAVWSPDGQRIAFSRNVNHVSTCYLDIFAMNADGSNVVRLTTEGAGAWCGAALWPAWSPDGQHIAYETSNHGGVPDPESIWTMAQDGSAQTRLTTGSNSSMPTWSLDGSAVYFASDRSGNYDLWKMNADGSNPVQLTTSPAMDFLPYWIR